MLSLKSLRGRWVPLATREVYADAWIRVRVDQVVRPNNTQGTYSVVELKGGVGVVALDESARILLVGQDRYATRTYSWEIPKGAYSTFGSEVTAGDLAREELREETGYKAVKWNRLGRVHTLLGHSNDVVDLFLARELTSGPPQPDESEILETQWVSRDEFWDLVATGLVTDATSIAAVALCERFQSS